jgi:hypothetical protein
MKQTAVEWLLEQWPILETQLPTWLIEQAKEMEKQQIQRAFIASRMTLKDAQQYYNETFKSE